MPPQESGSVRLRRAAGSPTTLLCIDSQRGLNTSHGFYGTERSTPQFEANVARLLGRCRAHNATSPQPIRIVHVFHRSSNPLSPLHPSGITQKDGIEFMPCAAPVPGEPVLSKTANSAFVSGELAELLQTAPVEQLVVVGIATDHCVSTSVRWAADLGVVGSRGKIALVRDATACFGKGGLDAETVQEVHLASLDGEFATVLKTCEVLADLFGE